MLAAAKLAEPHCVAVDINLGCPQRQAHSGRFGSFCRKDGDTTSAMDTALVLNIVATMAKGLKVPLFVKIRLFDEWEDTLRFCKQLEAAGCALLAVHGRYRGSPKHRRDGAAHLDQVRLIKEALSIPILTNGNVSNAPDLLAALELTGCDGVMSAEGALDDPALFGRAAALATTRRAELKLVVKEAKALKADAAAGRSLTAAEQAKVDGYKAAKKKRSAVPEFETVYADGPLDPCDLADEYLELATTHRPTLKCVVFHLRRMCNLSLRQFDLRAQLEKLELSAPERVRDQPISTAALKAARSLMKKLRDYVEGRTAFTPAAAAAAPSAAETKKAAAAAAGRVGSAAARAKANAKAVKADPKKMAAATAACAAKRKDFEQMQRKKAKRQGLPSDHFLEIGLAPPTAADVSKARGMNENERMSFWRASYGQHCIMHHMDGQCQVALAWGCGFLHVAAT